MVVVAAVLAVVVATITAGGGVVICSCACFLLLYLLLLLLWSSVVVVIVLLFTIVGFINNDIIPSGKNQSACSIKASTIPVNIGVFFMFICPLFQVLRKIEQQVINSTFFSLITSFF